MDKEKSTAIWEEDGDLMRIKQLFSYLSKEEKESKERIKQKTLSKIRENPEANHDSSVVRSQVLEENPQEQPEKKREEELGETAMGSSRRSKLKSLFQTLKKPNKRTITVAAACLFFVFITFSGSVLLNKIGYYPLGSNQAATEDAAGGYDGEYDIAPEAPAADTLKNKTALTFASTEETGTITAQARDNIETKIIYILDATVKVDDIETALEQLEAWVQEAGGYIAESERNNSDDYKRAFLSLRIPVASFEKIKQNLAELGHVTNQHLATEDVTQEYFDVETRLRNWEAQEKRYLEILAKAESVEDILKIENSLAEVRRQIDHLKGQLKYWDHRVDYSEIRVNLVPVNSNIQVNEPWEPVSLRGTLIAAKNAVIKSVSYIWNSFNHLLILVGYMIPVAVILAIIYLTFRRLRKKR